MEDFSLQEVDCVHSWSWPSLTFPWNHPCLPLFSIQARSHQMIQSTNFQSPQIRQKIDESIRYEKKYMEPFIVIGPVLIGGGIMTVLFSVEVTFTIGV